ncbi:MAG: 16S rRNA (cytosine(1402)-N(4))-methyltransferase RsmH [Rickettsiales bacterium]|nr:16S rRNA (cytosine(1402)-N(4))-methyltransferase RsmH [Rickettsiales bacterium]
MQSEESHISVLLKETLEQLNPQDGKTYLDCTFGAGGHSRAILESANCRVIALDRDIHTKQYAEELKQEFGDRFIYLNSKFSDLDEALRSINVSEVDGILFDIGVSSMQIDTPRRGFSFQEEGPLDMRMSDDGLSAEDFINEAKEEEIAGVIFRYGDERKSRQIASAIIRERAKKRITKTTQLANIILSVLGRGKDGIHPATRTFQAIRIYINDELDELKIALKKATQFIKNEGRICVITFHSGEDIIVKNFFREISGYNSGVSRYLPSLETQANQHFSEFELVTRKPILPSDFEIKNNVRARSAKLRVLQRKKMSLIN